MSAQSETMAYKKPEEVNTLIDPAEITIPVMLLDITKSINNYLKTHPGEELTTAHVLAYTQRAWKLDPDRANKAELILALCKASDKHRKVVGVFTLSREGKDKFIKSPWGDADYRYVFLGEPADESVWNEYIGLLLPPAKQGEANPVRYYEPTDN